MDFDAHVSKDSGNNLWKKDVLAVHNACADFSIPSYIEVSRSGNGGHLWIFFSENVLARLARNFGMALVKIAMQQRHSIPFESFDRFFPNQDEIQKGGYGNLIALPLQGKAVKEGHSVFVDENFIPYDDQWAHLSSVQKIDEKKIRRALAEIEKQIPDFVEKDEYNIFQWLLEIASKMNFPFHSYEIANYAMEIYGKPVEDFVTFL